MRGTRAGTSNPVGLLLQKTVSGSQLLCLIGFDWGLMVSVHGGPFGMSFGICRTK